MGANQVSLHFANIGSVDSLARQRAEAGVDAVDRFTALGLLIDNGSSCDDPRCGVR
jgi:hypothetical protein